MANTKSSSEPKHHNMKAEFSTRWSCLEATIIPLLFIAGTTDRRLGAPGHTNLKLPILLQINLKVILLTVLCCLHIDDIIFLSTQYYWGHVTA
jgi:hypothetical protein